MQNTPNPLVVRVSWPTPPSETLFIRFDRAVGFGRELRFLIADSYGNPISAIAASNMALGTQRYENPSAEIAESALVQNALFAALPQFLANQAGRTELYEMLQKTFIQLTSENLELLPRSAWVS